MQELFSKGLHIQEILQLCMIHTCIKGLIHGHMVPLKNFFYKIWENMCIILFNICSVHVLIPNIERFVQ